MYSVKKKNKKKINDSLFASKEKKNKLQIVIYGRF